MFRSAILVPCSINRISGAIHSRLMRSITALVMTMLLAVLAAPARPQTFRGAIVGTVSDVNGAAIPEAAVTARNIGTGLERKRLSLAASE